MIPDFLTKNRPIKPFIKGSPKKVELKTPTTFNGKTKVNKKVFK